MTYLLFAGPVYYPSGGVGDYQGAYDSLAAAMAAGDAVLAKNARGPDGAWAQIAVWDGQSLTLAKERNGGGGWGDPLPLEPPYWDNFGNLVREKATA